MSDESAIHGVDDTVRVAMGFIMGGFAAVYFDLGYVLVAAFAAGIVFLEVVYVFVSVWYEASQRSQQQPEQQ